MNAVVLTTDRHKKMTSVNAGGQELIGLNDDSIGQFLQVQRCQVPYPETWLVYYCLSNVVLLNRAGYKPQMGDGYAPSTVCG